MIDFKAMLDKQREVQHKKAAWEKAEENATDTSVKITGMPGGSGDGQKMANDVSAMVDAEQYYRQAEAELEEMKDALRPHLECLEKWQHKDVLKWRYMEGLKLDLICIRMNYSWSQISRYLDEAESIINGTF